jgi:hypothetical protein
MRAGIRRFGRAGGSASVVPVDAGRQFGGDPAPPAVASPPRARALDGAGFALLRERFGRTLLRAGWPGIGGVALLAGAAVFAYLTGAAIDERRAELAEERARLLRGEVRQTPGGDERERLKAFYDRFPLATELPARLRLLHELATAQGVNVQRTDYRSTIESGTPLLEVTLSIPVNGEFAALYGWLGELLREMPEVALDTLSVKRATTDTTTVEAELRLQLYVRGRP